MSTLRGNCLLPRRGRKGVMVYLPSSCAGITTKHQPPLLLAAGRLLDAVLGSARSMARPGELKSGLLNFLLE